MRDLINLTRKRDEKDFQIFLKVLEIYGVGYEDDINQHSNIDRGRFTHS